MRAEKVFHTNPDGTRVYRFRTDCGRCGQEFETAVFVPELTKPIYCSLTCQDEADKAKKK